MPRYNTHYHNIHAPPNINPDALRAIRIHRLSSARAFAADLVVGAFADEDEEPLVDDVDVADAKLLIAVGVKTPPEGTA